MKRIVSITVAAILSATVSFAQEPQDWAGFSIYEEANMKTEKGAKAVLIGDSITEGWISKSPAFFSDKTYICRGISGQVTAQMLARFRPDVISLEPECAVILAGTNDIAGNQGYISIENIFGNIVSMCELADYNGIKVIICSVLPAYEYPWKKSVLNVPEKIMELNRMLKRYARKHNFTYVDFHSAMKDSRNGLPGNLAKDEVHPTPEGYKIMEEILKPVIEKVCSEE